MIDDALGRLDDAAKDYEQLATATEHASGQYSDDEKATTHDSRALAEV